MQKRVAHIGGDGNTSMGNHGTANKSSQAGVWMNWRSNCSRNPVSKWYDSYSKGRRLRPCRMLIGWPLKPGHTGGIKKWLGSRSNPRKNTLYAAMRSPRRRGLFKECRLSRRSRSFIWQSAETLNEPRGQPLHMLQTVGVVCKVRHAGLHSLLKTCYKMGEARTRIVKRTVAI